ncbi:hypothetical protein ATCC90586_010287 [Pythium insidiosum]|nr:hypothetical protein ATCC90586_010287 [Pythium insidiosum]
MAGGHSMHKWHKKLALAFIDIARVNAYVTKCTVDKSDKSLRNPHRQFMIDLASELISGKWKETAEDDGCFSQTISAIPLLTLNGKNLLGFVKFEHYDGRSDGDSDLSDDSDDEPAEPPKSPESQVIEGIDFGPSDSELDPAATPHDGESEDTGHAKASDPPKVRSFSDTKERKARKKARAIRTNARHLRRQEAQTFAFLLKAMDNTHIRLFKDKETAYAVFQTICSKYEGVEAHGNPYTIMSFLSARRKNKIPIVAIGKVTLSIEDSKGTVATLVLSDVILAPALKFNLFSVPAAVKDGYRFTLNRKTCVINTNQRYSIKARIAQHADLYQFNATPSDTTKVQETAFMATSDFA